MERFLKRYSDRISGIIAGFDRILFQGTLQSICHIKGMDIFLASQRVLYKDFGKYAERLSGEIKAHAQAVAEKAGREVIYLKSAKQSKEAYVKALLERENIKEGLICVLKCVEPCQSFSVQKNGADKKLHLIMRERQCLHLYYYYLDREFGFMHVRLQTWFPFTIQVYINGREYLARQMDKRAINYEQRENSFTWIDDITKAQTIIDKLVERKWERVLASFARRVNPLIAQPTGILRNYYWSVRQCEYATDILFRNKESLAEIYPALVRHAMEEFSSKDVLRFLQRHTNIRFNGEVKTNLRARIEGVRVKHWCEENSIKIYDKHGSVLRIETTINNPKRFKVYRAVTRNRRRVYRWLPMRKGIVDMRRRAEVARAANERYLEALACVGESRPSYRLLDEVSRRLEQQGRSYRALRPISPEDAQLFQAILHGEFLLQGFRNKDIAKHLPAFSSAQITRLLRLLRAHGLIFKVGHTNYYRISRKGQEIMSTALRFRRSGIALLAA